MLSSHLGVISLKSSAALVRHTHFSAKLPTHLDTSGGRITNGYVEEYNGARDSGRSVERGRHGV